MATEVFWDTSGFFALLNKDDQAHEKAKALVARMAGRRLAVTTEWVIGECCTLLVARKRPHLVPILLDMTARSAALTILNPDHHLLDQAKAFLRKHLDQDYSFTDCLSFCVMRERRLKEGFTSDVHFNQAGFVALLV